MSRERAEARIALVGVASVWHRIRLSPFVTKAAGFILMVLLIASMAANWLRPLDTRYVDFSASLLPPSLAFPMGTDLLGRDLFAHVLHGLRLSFSVSAAAALVAVVLGGALGVLAGTFGGRIDALIMRGVDVFHAQNHFLLGMMIVVLFRPVLGPAWAVMLSVALTHWVSVARIVRGELLSLRERPFIVAAIGGGASRWRLVRRHYVPHLLPPVLLSFVLLVPHAIFHESGLSFLGLGMPADQASLGRILAESRQALFTGSWWMAFFPGALIFLTSLAIGILGEYWRDRYHPHWRSKLPR